VLNIDQEGLAWFDALGNPYLDAEEQSRLERARVVVAERDRDVVERDRDKLAAKLRIDPDGI
jgi:hypothetical protein